MSRYRLKMSGILIDDVIATNEEIFEELQRLEKLVPKKAAETCGFCTEPCGETWCSTRDKNADKE